MKNILQAIKSLFRKLDADVDKAQVTAKTAQVTAKTAQVTAKTAQVTAKTAQNTAEAAQNTAEVAQGTANAAQDTANAARDTANTALTKAVRFFDMTSSFVESDKGAQLTVGETTILSEEYEKTGLPNALKSLKTGDMMSIAFNYFRDNGVKLRVSNLIVTKTYVDRAIGGIWVTTGLSSPHYYEVKLGIDRYNSYCTRYV